MSSEKQPVTDLDNQEAAYQVKISAYGTVQGALGAFQNALKGLEDPGAMSTVSATSANTSVVTASASSNAVAGTDTVEVTNLAAAQKLDSTGFASADATVGSGSLTIQFGTYDSKGNTFTVNAAKAAKTVAIDPSHNTLSGIRDAINAAGAGVTASIVNDGTKNGYRLVVSSNDTGTANSLKISVSDDDQNPTDAAGLSQLAYDPTAQAGQGKNLSETQAAADAQLNIDGIPMTKSSNTVTDAIQGVTLNLLQKNVGAPTTVTVGVDSSAAKKSIDSFVSAYNTLSATLKKETAYDPASKTAQPLNGDAGTQSIMSQLRNTISATISNDVTYKVLGQIGVSFQKDGTLSVDDTKLGTALAQDPDAVSRLFAATGTATDVGVKQVTGADATKPGSYAVSITQLATQASSTGTQAAGLTVTQGVNDLLNVTIDGATALVTLAPGTYASADALAAAVQSAINGAGSLSSEGISVNVTQSNGILAVTSNRYGSASGVSIGGGDAMAALFGASTVDVKGVDVAGTIGGADAIGSGQTLTASSGGPANGLQLTVTGGALGQRGSVTYQEGVAFRLDKLIDQMNGSSGIIKTNIDGINSSIKQIGVQRDELNRRITQVEATYRAQFTALDQMVSQYQSTAGFLTQEISSLQATFGSSKSSG
jgi:flagellar hook-associated protein 2